MNYPSTRILFPLVTVFLASVCSVTKVFAASVPNGAVEISCNIITNTQNVECQWATGDTHKTMDPDDIMTFVDKCRIAGYVTVKSRKGFERTFLVDPKANQFKRLQDTLKTGPMSAINKTKGDIFEQIEKRVVKLSDDLDSQNESVDLVRWDPSVTNDKYKVQFHDLQQELAGYKKEKDKLCTSTPAYDKVTKANAGMQQVLSELLVAFQTPGTCMSDLKIFKDKDGSVDLKQLDNVPERFKTSCKK